MSIDIVCGGFAYSHVFPAMAFDGFCMVDQLPRRGRCHSHDDHDVPMANLDDQHAECPQAHLAKHHDQQRQCYRCCPCSCGMWQRCKWPGSASRPRRMARPWCTDARPSRGGECHSREPRLLPYHPDPALRTGCRTHRQASMCRCSWTASFLRSPRQSPRVACT